MSGKPPALERPGKRGQGSSRRFLWTGARAAGKDPGELHVLEDQELEDGSMPLILAPSSSKVDVGDWSPVSAP